MLAVSMVALACALALVGLGGGVYEVSVVDPSWPRRLDLIQPARGGISRRRFWIPAHVAFEAALVAALVVAWPETTVRFWLLLALGSHILMRLWSAFDFIPKALAFERAESSPAQADDAQRWTRRSRLRLPLDVVTCAAMMMAFAAAARLG
jgi:hypothetical protein